MASSIAEFKFFFFIDNSLNDLGFQSSMPILGFHQNGMILSMTLLLVIAVTLYLVAAVTMWRQLGRNAQLPKWFIALPIVAVILHAWIQWEHWRFDGFDHINITFSLSAVALLLVILAIARGTKPGGMLLRPVVYLFAAVSVILMNFSPVNWGAEFNLSSGLLVHVVLSLCAYAILMLATLYAIQILYVSYVLKHHKAQATASYLPPLMTAERYFFRLLSTGTFVLVIAIISGFVFLQDMFAQGQSHKTVLSTLAALIYVVIVFLHGARGVRGRAMVIASVVASSILTLAYFGSRFVKDVLLNT